MISFSKKYIALSLVSSIIFSNSVLAQSSYELNSNQYKHYNNYKQHKTLQGKITAIPPGTMLEAEIQTPISTSKNNVGDLFIAKVTQPLIMNTHLIIPAGSTFTGQITYKETAGRAGKNAILATRFISINFPDGRKIPVSGKIETLDKTGDLKGAEWSKQLVKSAAIGTAVTGAGTIAGLGIGAVAGNASVGAITGVSAGGALGLAYILSKKGKEVTVPVGTKILVSLREPLNIEAP
jgi:hypothetical protein